MEYTMSQATVNPITSNEIANQIVVAIRSRSCPPTAAQIDRIFGLVTDLSHLPPDDSTYAAFARAAALVGDLYSVWALLPDDVVGKYETRKLLTRALRLAWLQLLFAESYWGLPIGGHDMDYFASLDCASELFPGFDSRSSNGMAQAAE
jgi:hypothetical protein